MHAYKGLATHMATCYDVNPRYGSRKLNPGLPFSVATKNLIVDIFGAPTVLLYIVASHEYITRKVKSV